MADDYTDLYKKMERSAVRAEQASTAFNKVLTEDENTDVPVEGGSVPSMSKRIKQKMDASMGDIDQAVADAQAAAQAAAEESTAVRTDLADPAKGAGMVARATVNVPTIQGLAELTRDMSIAASVASYHDGWGASTKGPVGGGIFVWDERRPKSDHDGGRCIDPEKLFPLDWRDKNQRTEWFTSSNAGNGCWVSVNHGAIYASEYGARGGGVPANNDTQSLQSAIDSASGRKVIIDDSHFIDTVGACPDGSAGDYCLQANSPVQIISGGPVAEIIHPANQHGIIITSDFVSIEDITFKGLGTPGTIGHSVKAFGNIDSPSIKRCRFYNTSDAGVNFGVHLNNVLNNFDVAGFDPFTEGPKNITVEDNVVYDCAGDAAIEIQGVTGGVVKFNNMFNGLGHGIRCAGNRNLNIYSNFGDGLGRLPGAFSALVSAYSGAISPNGKSPIPLYNDNVYIALNIARNCKDGIHLGIGAVGLVVADNDLEVSRRPFLLLHSGSEIGRWGIKNSRILRNRAVGGDISFEISIQTGAGTPVEGTPIMDNVEITYNEFINFSAFGIQGNKHSVANAAQNCKIKNNNFKALDSSVTSTATDINISTIKDSDFTGNETTLKNGRELVIGNPIGSNIFPSRNRYKVNRFTSNNLVSPSREGWATGETVKLETDGVLPGGLDINRAYWISVSSATSVTLANSIENAFSGTAVTITDSGTGNHFLVRI